MPILNTNQDTLLERTKSAFLTISNNFLEHQELFIRRQFDSAVFDETALACIRLASEMVFNELAKEMIKDYNREVYDV